MDYRALSLNCRKYTFLVFLILIFHGVMKSQEKPIVLGEGMNLQKDYPVVPIVYGVSDAGMRTMSECWSSLGTGYIHINDKFTGQSASIPQNALDDGSYGPINLGWDYTFYGETYNSLYINVNGNITFGAPYSAYSPSGFPSTSVPAMVAPFWADVDLRGTGNGVNNVYVKLEPGKIIVQWVQVGFYNENVDPRNTFQVVLTDASDPDLGIGYNTRFAYGDMNWGVGNASGGTSGFGKTTYATVGAQANGGTKFYQIGLFGQNNENYDGPGGSIDGVHFLDGRCFTMDLRTTNVPPIANDLPESRQINLTAGMSYSLMTSYSSPESDQTTTVDINNSTLSVFNSESIPGNLSTQTISFTTSQEDIGSHYIYIHAFDDGIPSANTYDTILVNVFPNSPLGDGASLKFDGINDYVLIPHNNTLYSSGVGTFSFWIMPSSANNNQIETVLNKEGQYEVTYNRNSGLVKFTAWKDGAPYSLESITSLNQEEWNHVAFVYDGTSIKCYVEGELNSSVPFEGFPSNSGHPLYIGTNSSKEIFLDATIDELAYIGTAFNQDQIRKLMFELEAVKHNYKRYYYKCNTSPVLVDESSYQNNGVLNEFNDSICWGRNYASIWKGSLNSSWDAAENWESGLVPLAFDNGSILKENYVVIPKLETASSPLSINGSVEINSLVVQDSSNFVLQPAGNIVLKRNLYGNKNVQFLGTVNFNGTTTQKVFGENKLFNVSIDNEVYLEGNLDIKEDLILNSDVLHVNGKRLTLLSDTSGTAEIYHNSGSINGQVIAQRTIAYKANSIGWHYLTSPVIGATFSQVNEAIPLRGIGNGPNGNPWPNVYLYDETVPSQNKMVGWWSPDSLNQTIQQSQGFILYYNQSEPKTISFVGEVHTGQKNRRITFTNSNKLDSDGWNLVGNPYPSMLDWDMVSFPSTMDRALYVYDNKSDRYSSYVNGIGVNGGTSEVASTQSFFVKSSSETTFSLDNNARITGKNKGRFKTEPKEEFLKIRVETSSDKDEIVLVDNEVATYEFDYQIDAYKMSNDDSPFEIFFKWDEVRFSIKNLSLKENDVVPLYISAREGKYDLSFTKGDFFLQDLQVMVEDLNTNLVYDLSSNETIPFQSESVNNVHRFNLIFKKLGTTQTESKNGEKIEWSFNSNQLFLQGISSFTEIQIFDIAGKLVQKIPIENYSDRVSIPWKYATGIFIIKAQNAEEEKTLKVNVK